MRGLVMAAGSWMAPCMLLMMQAGDWLGPARLCLPLVSAGNWFSCINGCLLSGCMTKQGMARWTMGHA